MRESSEYKGYPIVARQGDGRDLGMGIRYIRGEQPSFTILDEENKPITGFRGRIRGKISSGRHLGNLLLEVDEGNHPYIVVPQQRIVESSGRNLRRKILFQDSSTVLHKL